MSRDRDQDREMDMNRDGQEVIVVSQEQYHWLVAQLEQPPRELLRLKRLLTEPSVFDAES